MSTSRSEDESSIGPGPDTIGPHRSRYSRASGPMGPMTDANRDPLSTFWAALERRHGLNQPEPLPWSPYEARRRPPLVDADDNPQQPLPATEPERE